VSEFFTAELSVLLNCGRGTASHLARRSWTYRENLPATWAALRAGEIDERRARELADVLKHSAPALARAVEARLLPEATTLSLSRLRARATDLLLELDAAGADERREEAQRDADVRVYPGAAEGMATLATDMPAEDAAVCQDVINQIAWMLKADGDPRPIGQIRSAVHSLLIRHAADHGLPGGVRIQLTVTASLDSLSGTSDAPGEVNGHPITAAHVRALLARAGAIGLQDPEGGSLVFALTDDDGMLLATLTLAELARLARRGCSDHPDGDCSCPLAGPPPETDAYEPTDAQRRWVKTRDRTCRFPNCARPVGWSDCDHVVPHADGGATSCANLCCLCRSHHRLKTFAPGWAFDLAPDGTLHVTTPAGITRSTPAPGRIHPPGAPPPKRDAAHSAQPPDPPAEDEPPPF
jgi:hypothetical protein